MAAPRNKKICFVLSPTKTAYGDLTKHKDFKTEMKELAESSEFDTAYFKKQGYECHRGYTGYVPPGEKVDFAMDKLSSLVADASPIAEVTICFSSHGSAGPQGKIGAGTLDMGFRLSVDELIQLLLENNFAALENNALHFQFNCCNSAYAPVPNLTKFSSQKPVTNEMRDLINRDVLNKTFIGAFYKKMQDNNFSNFDVKGVRGFYFPAITNPQVSHDKTSGKNRIALAEGTALIDSTGTVHIKDYQKFLKVLNIEMIDKLFFNAAAAENLPTMSSKLRK